MRNIFDLTGKTVVITGGAGYLGSAMSEVLAQYGADLFVLGRDYQKNLAKAKALKEKYSCKICESLPFSIDDPEIVKETFRKIVDVTEKIDVLINNAAYSSPGSVDEYSLDSWKRGLDGTINSTFIVSQQVLNYMVEQKFGNIINIGSMYGMVAPNMEIYGDSGQNNPANYGAGKAAVIQFTKYLASVYGELGIRVNCISPGPYPNELVQNNDEFVRNLSNKTMLKRIGQPRDLCGLVVYLASDASSYMTGQNIAVDGGWTAW